MTFIYEKKKGKKLSVDFLVFYLCCFSIMSLKYINFH